MNGIKLQAFNGIRWLRESTGARVLLLAALVLIVLAFAHEPMRAGAVSSGSTIKVGNTGDLNTADGSFSLREAILLATVHDLGRPLDHGECDSINDGTWNGSGCECVSGGCFTGADFADIIVFKASVFPPSPGGTIVMTSTPEPVMSDYDTIIGGEAVTIDGTANHYDCLAVGGFGNKIEGLTMKNCHVAIDLDGSLGPSLNSSRGGNTIGGTGDNEHILIESATRAVIAMYNGSDGNTVQNVITYFGSGSTNGVYINTSNNTIGNSAMAFPSNSFVSNVTSVEIDSVGGSFSPTGNKVINSCICGGSANGVLIDYASGNIVGGTDANTRNEIAGNSDFGVAITGPLSAGNTVEGNTIGGNVANGKGVIVDVGAHDNTIGGTTASARNYIEANREDGVLIHGAGTGNVVEGNYIGGINILANVNGVVVQDSNGTTIGGTTAGARNVISGNTGEGVLITGTSGLNVVEGNYVGVDHFGDEAAGMGNLDGVVIYQGAHDNTIGGTTGTSPGGPCTGACNVISGNSAGGSGVAISAGSDHNSIVGNYIGTNAVGNVAVANGVGIQIIDSLQTSIGDGTPAGRNVISGNMGGIMVGSGGGTTPSGTNIYGNYIGVGANGTSPLGNTLEGGIALLGSTNASIGGVLPETANIIAHNGGPGIQVSSGTNNQVVGNSIFSNAQRGINLQPNPSDPTKPNDDTDPDTGPNNYQNFPLLTSAVTASGSTEVTGTLNTTPNTAVTIEVFSNPACDSPGEGKTFLGRTDKTPMTDGNGNRPFELTGLPAVPVGQVVTTTATTADGTSEFSACITVTGGSTPAPTTPAATTPAATTPAATTPAATTPTPTSTVAPISLKGDANCNGVVNLFDIKTMLAKYAGVPEQLNALCHPDLDLNCDHTADVGDIIPFLWTQANLVPTLQPGCKPIGAQLG